MHKIWSRQVKPLFSYYGGKQRMAPNLLPLLPRHTVYVEPFCGGAALFWNKHQRTNGSNYREVLNDANAQLVNLYRVMQDEATARALIHRLVFTPYARAEYQKALEIYKNGTDCPIEAAWAFYVNANMSFAKKLNAGFGVGLVSQNQANSWANQLTQLSSQFERLNGVHIECNDALAIIKQWDSPQTLFYCDPPYPGTDQGHYSGYTHDDFLKLVDALDQCEGSFLLSNYDQPGIPNHWERYEFKATMSAVGNTGHGANARRQKLTRENTERTEVVWRMDRSHNMRDDLLRLFPNDGHQLNLLDLTNAC